MSGNVLMIQEVDPRGSWSRKSPSVVPDGFRIKINPQGCQSRLLQAQSQAASVAPQAEDDDIQLSGDLFLLIDIGFAVRTAAFKYAEPGRQQRVESVGIENHVGRQGNGNKPDQGGETECVIADMPKTDTHGDKNN